MMSQAAGISGRGRAELATLLGAGRRFVTPTDVVGALGVDPDAAAKKLSRWAEEGWVRRVRRGLYIGVPVDAANPSAWSEDALLVAAEVWSAVLLHGLDGGSPLGAHRADLSHDGTQDLRAGSGCDSEALGPGLPSRAHRTRLADVGTHVGVARRRSAPLRRPRPHDGGHLGPPETWWWNPPRRRDPRGLPRRARPDDAGSGRGSTREPSSLQAAWLSRRRARP